MKKSFYILAILLLLAACAGEQEESGEACTSLSADEAQKALLQAAETGDLEKVKKLLASGAYVNAKDDQGRTALYIAALEGNLELVKLLVAGGAKPEIGDNQGRTALHEIAESLPGESLESQSKADARLEVAEFLLSKGLDPDIRDDAGMTPLHVAALVGNWMQARDLIARGADVNATDDEGRTPLDIALADGEWPMATILREHGARTEKTVYASIAEAAKLRDIAKVRAFLAAGAEVDSRGGGDLTALHYAAGNGDLKLTELLIENGANVNATGGFPFKLISGDSEEGSGDALEEISISGLRNGSRLVKNLGITPLHKAAQWNYEEVAQLLIDKGADINPKDRNGQTPLDWAITEELKELLRKHGGKSGSEIEKE